MKMKKIIAYLIISILIIIIFPIQALAASSSLSGPSTVRSGDTISVKFVLSGLSDVKGVQANISYSNSVLTYKGCTGGISSWKVSANNTGSSINIVAADEDSLSAISGTQTICTLKFAVNGSTGTSFSVSASNIKVSVNGSDVSVGGSTYSKNIAAPLSTNANLATLSASNAKISPSFSASTTSYKTSVDYAISSLSISATAADSAAKVKVTNNSLKAGATTSVKVTVTAAAGNTKTYTINATRAQDPNYVASTDNYLSSISLSAGMLSPAFNKDVTSYVVWLPYEVGSITAGGVPQDAKASVRVVGGESLIEGDNQVSVICAAENGAEKEYKITVKRASSGQTTGPADITGVLAKFESLSSGEDVDDDINILLDLSTSASKQIPAKLFEELKKYPHATLTINLGNVKIVFKGEDITDEIKSEYYDLSFLYNSEYADLIRGKANDENGIVFSYAYEGNLPGYAVFYLMTNLTEGSAYNIYKYNLEEDKFYLIAKNVTVGQAGILPYANNTCSEYIITKNNIEGAVSSESVSKQGAVSSTLSAYKDDLAAILILIIAAGIGFALGIVFNKTFHKKAKKIIDEMLLDNSEMSAENIAIVYEIPENIEQNAIQPQEYAEVINENTKDADNKEEKAIIYAEDINKTETEETAENKQQEEETV